MSTQRPFSDRVVSHLRLADHRLRTSEPGSNRRRYSICRMTLHNIAPIDSFYLGFFHGEDTVVIPYIYDHDRHLQPDVTKFGKGGLSHWIRSSGRPYVFRSDDGALLSRTIPFGDPDEISADAVIVPLKDPDTGDITGLMSIQSLTPDVYDDEVVHAALWLGEALMLAQARDRHVGAAPEALYSLHPELNSAMSGDPRERFVQITDQLEAAYRRTGEIARAVEQIGDDKLLRDIAAVRMTLEQTQVDMAEWMLTQPLTSGADDDQQPVRVDLTPREHQIATMIATERLTNAQIAQELGISLKTVKTHVGSVLGKLGVGQRSAIVFAMADLLATSPPEPRKRS